MMPYSSKRASYAAQVERSRRRADESIVATVTEAEERRADRLADLRALRKSGARFDVATQIRLLVGLDEADYVSHLRRLAESGDDASGDV